MIVSKQYTLNICGYSTKIIDVKLWFFLNYIIFKMEAHLKVRQNQQVVQSKEVTVPRVVYIYQIGCPTLYY